MGNAGFDLDKDGPPAAGGEPSEEDMANSAWFLDRELRPTTRYVPEIAALQASSTRVVVGIGVDSSHLVTYRTSMALAEKLDTKPVEFPGDHGGFMDRPGEFAQRLTEVLSHGSQR